ncbi:glycerol-3-phosphate 1-O-acyltransferase PlsY [Mollicutes bacterium LVI A0039]|nr:glycerol-3-phosphate 1-O-acyltransferase PlsY [Mollicutes bacterium LVI A0039]
MLKLSILLLCIYLFGSIPFSLLVGFMFGKDIRTEGSGNVGGSNLGRTCGKKAFVLGFLLDFSKGAIAVLVANYFGINPLLAGAIAILGHTFPIFLKFKGGKGVATAFGFVCAYSFWGAMFAITIFLIVLKISKYVSLSSIVAIGSYFLYTLFFQPAFYSLAIFGIFMFVTFMHRTNIQRIKAGNETKITWM